MVAVVYRALHITGFVLVMMLVIEYLNVLTQGLWQQTLRGSRWRQWDGPGPRYRR